MAGLAVAHEGEFAGFHFVASLAGLGSGQSDRANLRLAIGRIGIAFFLISGTGLPAICVLPRHLPSSRRAPAAEVRRQCLDSVQAFLVSLHDGPTCTAPRSTLAFRRVQAAQFSVIGLRPTASSSFSA